MQDVTDDSRRLENEVFQVYKHLLKATVIKTVLPVFYLMSKYL